MGGKARKHIVQHALVGRRVVLGEDGQTWLVTGALRAPGRGGGFAFRVYRTTCAGAVERWTGYRPAITAIEVDGPPLVLQQLAALAGVMRRCMPDVPEADRATDEEWDSTLAAAEAVLATHQRMETPPCAP